MTKKRNITLFFFLQCLLLELITIYSVGASEGIFLHRIGIAQLPYVYVLTSISSVFFSILYSSIVTRVSYRFQICCTFVVFASVNLLFFLGVAKDCPLLYYFFIIVVGVFIMIARIQLWLLINQHYSVEQAKRLFPLFLAGELAGGCIGWVSSVMFGSGLSLMQVQLLGLFFIVTSLILFLTLPKEKRSEEIILEKQKSFNERLYDFKQVGSLFVIKMFGLIVIANTILLTLVDFQFNKFATENFVQESSLISFFIVFRSIVTICALVVQLLLTSRLMRFIGFGVFLLITPIISVFYSMGLVFLYGAYSVVSAKFISRFLSKSIQRSAYQVIFNPFEKRVRDYGKLFVEGVMYSLGMLLGAGLIFISTKSGSILSINFACLIVAILFLYFSREFKKNFYNTATLKKER